MLNHFFAHSSRCGKWKSYIHIRARVRTKADEPDMEKKATAFMLNDDATFRSMPKHFVPFRSVPFFWHVCILCYVQVYTVYTLLVDILL